MCVASSLYNEHFCLTCQLIWQVLRQGGLLAFTMPLLGSSSYVRTLRTMSTSSKWSSYLQDFEAPGYPHNPRWIEGKNDLRMYRGQYVDCRRDLSAEFLAEYHPKPTKPTLSDDIEKMLELQKQEFVDAYRVLLPKCGFVERMMTIHPAPSDHK